MLSRRLPLNRSFNFPQKRFFATENAPTSKLKLTFTIPSGAFYKAKEVYLVKVPGVNGEMGLMANHVPTIAELKPGVVDVVVNANDKPDQYFISGGFAFMERDSTCAVSVIEAVRLSELGNESFLKMKNFQTSFS